MKPVTVNLELIAQSMRDICRETNEYFLDKTSGKVLCLSRVLIKAFAERSDDVRDAVPDWDAPLIPIAREIVVLGSAQYVRIPEAFGRPEHKWMLEFCRTVRGTKLKQKLAQSLKGRESCHRFKEILKEHVEEFNRWQVFRQKKWEESVQRWLEKYSLLGIPAKSGKKRAAA